MTPWRLQNWQEHMPSSPFSRHPSKFDPKKVTFSTNYQIMSAQLGPHSGTGTTLRPCMSYHLRGVLKMHVSTPQGDAIRANRQSIRGGLVNITCEQICAHRVGTFLYLVFPLVCAYTYVYISVCVCMCVCVCLDVNVWHGMRRR
ncbi:unnamed protein product [Protopolystoma xenopodis]|uniref:Uncharacterized protein n=1 Tax=Protopolystoma xenopodis TaxID=117903 RepID=A0A448WCV8_9PLAT|nr:unnamed protein product [Protopolystoma xenopodis]